MNWTCPNPTCRRPDIPAKLDRCICGAQRPRAGNRSTTGNARCACGARAMYPRGAEAFCSTCNEAMERAQRSDHPAEVALRREQERLGLIRRRGESAEDFRRRCVQTGRQLLGRDTKASAA